MDVKKKNIIPNYITNIGLLSQNGIDNLIKLLGHTNNLKRKFLRIDMKCAGPYLARLSAMLFANRF